VRGPEDDCRLQSPVGTLQSAIDKAAVPRPTDQPTRPMSHATHPAARVARAVALFLLGSALFAAAYGPAPPSYSTQNQSFLHALADAGYGLRRDAGLAKTADPTPVFSALVAVTARYLHPWAFHVYHAFLQGVYAAAMVGLFVVVAGETTAARR